jgi:ABC-2 type transport system ATP-binding protein
LTGEQNLILIARLLGFKREQAKNRTNELLQMFDLSEAGRKIVKTYSGGMHRRLDIAASIIKIPELLFLDEPTTGLDPRSRNVVWNFTRQLAKNGTTIFLTTQYLEEADRLADLVAVLEGGKIVAKETPSELKELVGRKTIKIRFADTANRDMSKFALNKIFPQMNFKEHEADLLSAEILDMALAASIINELGSRSIKPLEYSVSQATLDEVFFTFTGDKINE